MKTILLNVPNGVTYLSEWGELDKLLPHDQHFILDKKVTGCGATEKFLRDKEPVIIAMPRKHLLYNKYSQHLSDGVFLYRFLDKRQYFSDKTPSQQQLATFDDLLADYLQNGGKKILTTYDSLSKIIDVMKAVGIELNDFKVVVDEMQQIFGDAPIKANIEHKFYLALKKFKTVIYLSATPFLEEYLEMSEQFRTIPIVKLVWNSTMISKSQINMMRLSSSIAKKCCEIISSYKCGNSPTIKRGEEIIHSEEAVFFLNDVGAIIDIIEKAGLKPNEVNILCAPRRENISRLDKLSKKVEVEFEIGTIPASGEPNKKFTFCTSTVYIGSDFYSTNAYTYIFANPNVQSLCLDVATDLQQILGRQRSAANPFRNMADFYYHLKKPITTQQENEAMIEQKKQETQRQIENFRSAPHPDSMLEAMESFIQKSNHNTQYCCISEDEHGKKTIVENSLIWIAERRAWDIANKVYSGDFSLFQALKLNSDVSQDIDSADEQVRNFFTQWNIDGKFKRRAILYCDTIEAAPELIEKCRFIPVRFHEYYMALGREGMADLQWRADKIELVLAPIPPDELPHEKIAERLKSELEEGKEYTKDYVKTMMKRIYTELSIAGKPSAIDCSRYLTVEEFSRRINKKKVAMIRIVSHNRKIITYFPSITDVKHPKVYNIDMVLDMIKEGKANGIARRVTEIRNATTKEERDKLKGNLPAIAWNGQFKYRDCHGCDIYSSFTAIDFDHIESENMEAVKHWLESFPYVYAYFRSPGGNGLKAIILHDSLRPAHHADLYAQLLEKFKCNSLDSSTSDLGRGNYLSYDPTMWRNPSPTPFHYIPSEHPVENVVAKTQTVVCESGENMVLTDDDDMVTRLLLHIDRYLVSDESIMNILRKAWNQSSIDRGRNNTALSYAGVLCKAGVMKEKVEPFIASILSDLPLAEITHAVDFAYTHNIFGCNRRKYIKSNKKH